MSRRCCCPGEDCIYFEDDFNRADDTDLGADWTEAVGDWSVSSNKLSVSSSDAVVTCDETDPDGDTAVIVVVTLQGVAGGDQLRILVDYVDADNYWFGEVEWATDGYSGVLRLYQRSDGENILFGRVSLAAAVVGSSIALTVCIGGGRCSVSTPTETLVANATESTSQVALATGPVSGAVTFDDVSVSKHNVDQTECPRCKDHPCQYFEDDFNRPNNNDLSSDWDETNGVWIIDGNALVTASDGAICQPVVINPMGSNYVTVQVNAKGAAVGDKMRLYVEFTDHDHSWCLEVTLKAGDKADVTLYKNGAIQEGPDEISLGLDSFVMMRMCFGSNYVYGGVFIGPIAPKTYAETDTCESAKVAVGASAGGGAATFDDFIVAEHPETLPYCSGCWWRGTCEYTQAGFGGATLSACIHAATEMVVDFGIGGWTNGTGTKCGDVSGEFNLDWKPPYVGSVYVCSWRYYGGPSWDMGCGGIVPLYIHMVLVIQRHPDGGWCYILSLTITHFPQVEWSYSTVQYRSGSVISEPGEECISDDLFDPVTGKMKMTKIPGSETHTTTQPWCQPPCAGLLPEEIYVWPV